MRETMQGLQDTYTTDQVLQVTEHNARRQQEISLCVTNRDDSTCQDLPPGQKCNIDN